VFHRLHLGVIATYQPCRHGPALSTIMPMATGCRRAPSGAVGCLCPRSHPRRSTNKLWRQRKSVVRLGEYDLLASPEISANVSWRPQRRALVVRTVGWLLGRRNCGLDRYNWGLSRNPSTPSSRCLGSATRDPRGCPPFCLQTKLKAKQPRTRRRQEVPSSTRSYAFPVLST